MENIESEHISKKKTMNDLARQCNRFGLYSNSDRKIVTREMVQSVLFERRETVPTSLSSPTLQPPGTPLTWLNTLALKVN